MARLGIPTEGQGRFIAVHRRILVPDHRMDVAEDAMSVAQSPGCIVGQPSERVSDMCQGIAEGSLKAQGLGTMKLAGARIPHPGRGAPCLIADRPLMSARPVSEGAARPENVAVDRAPRDRIDAAGQGQGCRMVLILLALTGFTEAKPEKPRYIRPSD